MSLEHVHYSGIENKVKDGFTHSSDNLGIKKRKKNFSQSEEFQVREHDSKLEPNPKKRRFDSKNCETEQMFPDRRTNTSWNKAKDMNNENFSRNFKVRNSIVYYEKILQSLKAELKKDSKVMFARNTLQESEGKEVELCCHGITSYCIELLLTECKDPVIMERFMFAFAHDKVSICTSANASHITEKLICYAVKAIQNWSTVLNSEEDSEEKKIVLFCLNWLTDFAEFAIENMNDCLYDSYACHVICTLVRGLSGDLSKPAGFMSKNLKAHKQEFRSQYIGEESSTMSHIQESVVLETIPKLFKKALKLLYKSLINSEIILDSIINSSTAIVIEALLHALKKRLPKNCKKMMIKLAEALFSERDHNGVPLSLLHKNCSFVVDEMFKLADDELQLVLWNQHVVNCLGKLVTHSVGNFVIQRIFDVIQTKAAFESVCEAIWPLFDEILKSQNFGVFVSLAAACNRLSALQAPFMKNIMLCLHCYEPEERQSQVLPLLLGFQMFESYSASKDPRQTDLRICLQGSLTAQAVLKFHKPLKVTHSILGMKPTEIEFLAGHFQGCHVLNAFFGSISVGEKNKEKLLHQLKPVIISIACDRQKSLTLSRIWVLLSCKLKEIIARELAANKETLVSSSSGYAIWMKFGIHHFRRLPEWREIQANMSYNKKPKK